MNPIQSDTDKPKFRRLHQETCGNAREEYDSYDDVRLACERKLMEWERAGIIPPWRPMLNNDWIFAK